MKLNRIRRRTQKTRTNHQKMKASKSLHLTRSYQAKKSNKKTVKMTKSVQNIKISNKKKVMKPKLKSPKMNLKNQSRKTINHLAPKTRIRPTRMFHSLLPSLSQNTRLWGSHEPVRNKARNHQISDLVRAAWNPPPKMIELVKDLTNLVARWIRAQLAAAKQCVTRTIWCLAKIVVLRLQLPLK